MRTFFLTFDSKDHRSSTCQNGIVGTWQLRVQTWYWADAQWNRAPGVLVNSHSIKATFLLMEIGGSFQKSDQTSCNNINVFQEEENHVFYLGQSKNIYRLKSNNKEMSQTRSEGTPAHPDRQRKAEKYRNFRQNIKCQKKILFFFEKKCSKLIFLSVGPSLAPSSR